MSVLCSFEVEFLCWDEMLGFVARKGVQGGTSVLDSLNL